MSNFNFKNYKHLTHAICEKNLGNGGFAFVRLYKCLDKHENNTECNKLFVVKQIRYLNIKLDSISQMHTDINHLKLNINNEYTINKILDHENIIKTFDFDEEKSSILYEYFDAEDMLDYLNNNSNKNISFLLSCYRDLLHAIDYLHSTHFIAHMDIKLENILIDNNTKKIKLIDFGFSRYFKLDNKYIYTSEPFGTESYLPPEFYIHIRCHPDKVDIWCLGIILYNLIYDRMPWECAIQTDKNFYNYKYMLNNFNKFPSKTFQKCNLLSDNDNIIILECFNKTLTLNPLQRCDIKQLISEFNKLSLLNEL
jgi:serine/threonine protein kinase